MLKNSERIPQFRQLLDVYTTQLAKYASDIVLRREKFLRDIEPCINEKLKTISSNNENVEIDYLPSSKAENIANELYKSIEIDIKAKTTTVGPHRDDMIFKLNGVDARVYGSQGQQRSIALAVKLGLAEYLKTESNKIIIILDDVFGELDKTRQNELINAVIGDTQVLITTINSDNIDENIIKRSNIINLGKKVTENGR